MRFFHAITIAASLAALSCKESESRTRRASTPGLVGTWRAVEFVNPLASDTLRRWPLGKSPRAYLVYDATGHVFFQAVSGLAASPEARGHWFDADSSDLRALLASAAAYFGTYIASPQNGTVIHRIEGEIPPNSGTTEIATPYELRTDTLILGRDSSAHWKFLRVRP
jgi:hypothetical protein